MIGDVGVGDLFPGEQSLQVVEDDIAALLVVPLEAFGTVGVEYGLLSAQPQVNPFFEVEDLVAEHRKGVILYLLVLGRGLGLAPEDEPQELDNAGQGDLDGLGIASGHHNVPNAGHLLLQPPHYFLILRAQPSTQIGLDHLIGHPFPIVQFEGAVLSRRDESPIFLHLAQLVDDRRTDFLAILGKGVVDTNAQLGGLPVQGVEPPVVPVNEAPLQGTTPRGLPHIADDIVVDELLLESRDDREGLHLAGLVGT